MKILIVEDEPSLRELIQRSLEKERYVVETAGDFNSALYKIEDYDYDCVLLDIMLPDGSGLDLLERLKALHKRENVIIISAKDSLEDKVLGLEYDILLYFINRPGRLVNKNTLAESVWGDHIDQVDNFDFIYAQIKNLRKKLKDAEANIEIKAVYGFGYKLIVE